MTHAKKVAGKFLRHPKKTKYVKKLQNTKTKHSDLQWIHLKKEHCTLISVAVN